jgi:flavorubredoxin
METHVDQIADTTYRISTCIPEVAPGGFTFNQFLVLAEEPLLYHTGMRGLFPLVSEAVERLMPLERLRWISFAHVEADECGAVNELLAAAPHAQVTHGQLGCLVSLGDLCDRPPRPLADGEVLDIGGAVMERRVMGIPTPHVPHNWESHVLFDQTTGTLFCGDLCTQLGDGVPVTDEDLVEPAIAAEELFHQTSLGPAVPATYRRLADLEPSMLAIMHGSSYQGDCAGLLRTMADVFEERFGCGTGTTGAGVPRQQASGGAGV